MVAEDKDLPRPVLRHKHRIPTPSSSSDTDELSEAIITQESKTAQATLRVEEKDQEDSLKKRLRLFTSNNGHVHRMNGHYNEDVVIESYAQRRQQFVQHGRSQSDSSHTFLSSAASSGSRRERSTSAIFSIFRWFRKENRSGDFDAEFAPSAPPSPQLIRGYSSSCGSVDTLFSTATVNSFAFVHPAFYRPFGTASQPEKRIAAGPETETYRRRLKQRDRIRELDQNLTLKKKYHLFGSDTLHRSADDVNANHFFLHKSLDSVKIPDVPLGSKNSTLGRKKRKAPPPPLAEEKSKESSLPSTLEQEKEISDNNIETPASAVNFNRPRHRRTVSDSAKERKSGAFVHVKGKRKAPPPPVVNKNKDEKTINHDILGTQSLGRKKRPAPAPPVETSNNEKNSNWTYAQGILSTEEKQRLIENIAKLQAHADRRSILLTTPPPSPTLDNKMSHTVCNDSLKLERGVLKPNKSGVQSSEAKPFTPTPVSPRPWYKRNMASKEKSLEKKKNKNRIDDWMPEVAIARGNVITQDSNSYSSTNSSNNSSSYRLSNLFSRFEKPEEKRKSQISMLVNISELDREAAEIVQREQEKEKAMLAAQDAKFYTSGEEPLNIVHSNNVTELKLAPVDNKAAETTDSPRRTGARELISLFNAIGNVTKVSVNSAFFSKGEPNNCTKEGIEKKFSMSGDSMKTSEERVFKESISQVNGYKRETVIIETKETYLESPGVKRRRNLYHQEAKDVDSVSSSSSEAASPKVVIEEIEEFDAEKSKTQALFEANKVRKHHSPSPSIPTIAEMSESISSVTTTPGSTINPTDRSVSTTPVSVKPVSTSEPAVSQPTKNYSIWTCPRCTLENPRWRVTCEACDMWRPAVRKDVIDKLTNANMGATIAVNVIKGNEHMNRSKSPGKGFQSCITSQAMNSVSPIKENNIVFKSKNGEIADTNSDNSTANKKSLSTNTESVKPMTVSGLLSQNSYKVKEVSIARSKGAIDTNDGAIIGVTSSAGNNNPSNDRVLNKNINIPNSTAIIDKTNLEKETKAENTLSTSDKNSEVPMKETSSAVKDDSNLEEVRKARLAFFKKSLSDDKNDEENNKEGISKNRASLNQAKIDALFSIASKGSIATNEEERLKMKEILKEMKNSLPKRSKQDNSESKSSKAKKLNEIGSKENNQNANNSSDNSNDAARLGAIRKSTAQNPAVITSKPQKKMSNETLNGEKKAEVYLVKAETVFEEIKVKSKDGTKVPKVSTSVQTNGIIRKIESGSSATNNEGDKSVMGKPPTPKTARKEILVPVTVEEHMIKDGAVHTSISKEPRKMGIGTFELIRPRDFACIEATKTGNEGKAPIVHVYANIPTTHNEDSSAASTSSSSSESPEISQLTAQLTKPKGLADFKAAVLENTAGMSKMNTLAVNRLLRQLEAAIVGGQHQRAATLAKELARHKVNCCVTRHKQTDMILVDMYVEDKLSHQGPFTLQISPSMTVIQLKAKVEREFEIPMTVQRWILGKELAADDKATLQQLAITKPHCPIFLYLVAPDINQDKSAAVEAAAEDEAPKTSPAPVQVASEAATGAAAVAPPGRGWYFNEEDDRYSFCESEVTDVSSKDASPEPQTEVASQAAEEVVVGVVEGEQEEVEKEGVALGRGEAPVTSSSRTPTIGWKCSVCTLVNAPTRPGCLACAADRPVDYRMPEEHQESGTDRQRMDQDQQSEQAAVEDKLKNYQELMVLENADLIPSTEPFECSVCLMACEAQDGVVLRDCLHTFCRTCLAHTVQFTEDAEVKCPFRDHSYACDSTLQEREIKALVTPDVYEQHLAKSVTQAENKIGNAFHCKSPDCPGWCIFEDNVNTFQCPVCNQTNCLTCQAIHSGLDCKQYQEKAQQEAESNADARRTREMLEEMVQRGEALTCPTCQVVLMKKWGCDWLRCSMCKTEICWVTRGPRWGPNGKGDTSGGCKCGVNGVKCHPKCNYCH